MDEEVSVEQFEQYRLAADDAARNTYQQSMLAMEGEKLAFQKAQQAWKETMDKAGLTGMYEGQYTMPVQQWQAETFGTWGAPGSGQQTLEAQQQQWQQAFNQAQLYGQNFAPGGGPGQGQQTLQGQQQAWAQAAQQAAQFGQWYAPGTQPTAGQTTLGQQEQAYTQWLRAAQEARANQTAQQQTAQNYLQLMSQLRGPADWAKYQEVLGATPGGMRDLVAASMGQYIPGGGATTGVNPQAATLQSMQQQIAGQGGGTNTMGDSGQMNMPAPNQIAPQTWKNLAPSQQQMLLGQYEAQGWHKPDVEALFAQSLPKYAANAPGAGTWRLGA